MPVRKSSAFYRRGVTNSFKDFGVVATGNYTIFQPTTPFINSAFFSRKMNNIIYYKK